MESEFPTEAGLMLRNIENQGDPWGLGASKRTEWTDGARLRGPGHHRHHPRRHRVPLLGGLRRRPRRAGPQGGPGHRPHAAPGRGDLRHPRAQGVLHRGPGPPPGQRVPLPGAGQGRTSRPWTSAGVKKVIATCPHCFNSLANEYPALGRELRGHPPQPAARPPGHSGQAHARRRLHGHGHLPRPLLPGPAQPGLRRAPLGHRRHPRCHPGRDEALPGEGLLLRRRRRPHVAGGEHRQAGQHGAHRRGHRDRAPTWSRPPVPTA